MRELLEAAQAADARLHTRHPDARLQLTIGFESGLVSGTVVQGRDYEEWKTYGPTVNLAARLQSACGVLERGVVCGPGSWALLRDEENMEFLGAVTLKGIAEPVPAYAAHLEEI